MISVVFIFIIITNTFFPFIVIVCHVLPKRMCRKLCGDWLLGLTLGISLLCFMGNIFPPVSPKDVKGRGFNLKTSKSHKSAMQMTPVVHQTTRMLMCDHVSWIPYFLPSLFLSRERENFTLKCNQIFSGERKGRALPWNVNKWLWGRKSLNVPGARHNLCLPAFMT